MADSLCVYIINCRVRNTHINLPLPISLSKQDDRVCLRCSGYATQYTYIYTYAYKRSTGEWTMVNSNSFPLFSFA